MMNNLLRKGWRKPANLISKPTQFAYPTRNEWGTQPPHSSTFSLKKMIQNVCLIHIPHAKPKTTKQITNTANSGTGIMENVCVAV